MLVGAGGWFAGTQVKSPADAAAGHTPPKPGPVTVAVEERDLTATVVATGTVEFSSPQSLTLAGQVGSSGPGDESVEQRVTKAPAVGTVLKEGDVLMSVSGRPVFVLSGTVPMYRSIVPGTKGEDVTQLQEALRRIGFAPGTQSGTYLSGTADAVTQWYKARGFEAQAPTEKDKQELTQLQQAVNAAQLALIGAKDSESEKKTKELELKSAQMSLDSANSALSSFNASYGTKIPAGEVIFLPKLPVRVDKVKVKAGDTPAGELGTVTGSELMVQAVVPGADAVLLKKGMTVDIEAQGGTAQGKVEAIGDDAKPGTGKEGGAGSGGTDGSTDGSTGGSTDDGTGGSGASGGAAPAQLRISVADMDLLKDSAGTSVKVTIKVGTSGGSVLAVPVAAVRSAENGGTRVKVQRDGKVVEVAVTTGISAGGFVEVKADGGALKKGDHVVVGQ
ncbi:Tat pathway signal protein [Streptomyces paludis]|uniref:Tat pathway signal protein n=1 Tax=Streptomyces paludis TaxID=2282738 RepID=A0A345I166_9ACTN|nr:Tat pathway signal protein [Streptomyces paludis]